MSTPVPDPERPVPAAGEQDVGPRGQDRFEALQGEPGIPNVAQARPIMVSKRRLLAVAVVIVAIVAWMTHAVEQRLGGGKKPEDVESKHAADRPAAASTDPRRLDMPAPTVAAAASAAAAPTRIPALIPTADELADPIGVHRVPPKPAPQGPTPVAPEDAPAVLVSSRPGGGMKSELASAEPRPGSDTLDQTRRDLDAYRQRLQGLLETLTQRTAANSSRPASTLLAPTSAATQQALATPAPTPAAAAQGLFAGQLQGSATPRTTATLLGNRSLILPKGTAFTCALKARVVSATSGMVGCQVQRNVYSEDGRVLLIERGAHLDGEYRVTSIRPGTVRIPVLWTRIRTPNGVSVDIESPGTGALGESGVEGYVDNRWPERIGAALLLSLIDDSVKLVIQSQQSDRQGNAVILQSTTDSTSKLAEKVLDSTINIPPLIYQNQGGIVGIYVARDVDFSSVYELRPK
jgi:type IV secretion system protein VirB10